MRARLAASMFVFALLACAGALAGSPKHTAAVPHAPVPAPSKAGAPVPAPREAQPFPRKKADATTPGESWAGLLEGNRRFMQGTPQTRETVRRRAELAGGQHPGVVVLGCSDSRVPPELLFDRNLGDLFVVRTAGHVVDRVALGSIEYAVEHLHAGLLVVLGHEKCGAVAAAAGETPSSPGLQAIVEQIRPSLEKLGELVDGPALVSLGIEVNVHQTARGLLENSAVIREHVDAGKLGVVKALYRLESGEVVKLD